VETEEIAAAAARVRARVRADFAALEACIGRPVPKAWNDG
jgi:hypothetical protein